MNPGLRRVLIILGKSLLTIVLVLFLLSRISLREAFALLTGAAWPLLFLALLVYALSVFAGAWQWGRFLEALGIKLRPAKLLEFYWVGLFFNNFMPGNMGGDVVKVLDLRRGQRDPVASGTATLADRLTGLNALAFWVLLAGSVLSSDPALRAAAAPLVIGAATILLLGVLFFFDPVFRSLRRLTERIGLIPAGSRRARVLDQLRLLQRKRGLVLRLFVLSLLIQALRIGVHFVVGRAIVGAACPPLAQFILVIPPVAFAASLPVTLGGFGLREGSAVIFFGLIGFGDEAAVIAIQLLAYLLMLLVSLQGGVLFLLRRSDSSAMPGSGTAK